VIHIVGYVGVFVLVLTSPLNSISSTLARQKT
jgi:hypothetical protein